MKKTIKNTFIQLLVIYSIVIFLTSLNLLGKFSLHFHIAAIIIAILGAITLK